MILFNYYSVSLSEYVSSTAAGTVIALGVLVLALGALIRYLTRNEYLAYAVAFVLLAIVTAVLTGAVYLGFEGIIWFLRLPAEIAPLMRTYLKIVFAGLAFLSILLILALQDHKYDQDYMAAHKQ